MTRSELIAAGIGGLALGTATISSAQATVSVPNRGKQIQLPKSRRISVAFALGAEAAVIDFAGPWEVFGETMVPSLGPSMDEQMPFDMYHVAKTLDPVVVEGGMRILPRYTFANAPQSNVIVVGAQAGSADLEAWLKSAGANADVTASVCTGAFQLARAGLFDGLPATTHHAWYDRFAREFPKVHVVRGARYVENDHVSSAGGLSSGIDLALRIVERYFGTSVADQTAAYLEFPRRPQFS